MMIIDNIAAKVQMKIKVYKIESRNLKFHLIERWWHKKVMSKSIRIGENN